MPVNIFCFTAGIWLVTYLRNVHFVQIYMMAGFLIILIGGGCWSVFELRGWRVISLNLIFLGGGLAEGALYTHLWLAKRLDSSWVGREITTVGTVSNLPAKRPDEVGFMFLTTQFAGQSQHLRLRLNWKNPYPPLHAGERWRLTVRLKPPHSLTNFGTETRQRVWWERGIHAGGYVVSHTENQYLGIDPSPYYWVLRWREQLRNTIDQAVHDPNVAAIVTALTIGVEDGLTDADWLILQRTGTVHLVVIAGLHIGFLVWMASLAGNLLWRCWPWLLLRLPAQRAATVFGLIFALGYGALAGFSIPTQRAVMMTIVFTLSQWCSRSVSMARRLLVAFWVVVVLQPGALFSAGFWLSFGAVAWIAYSLNDEWRSQVRWRRWLRMQGALWLGLTPLTIYFFQQFSLVSLLANLPAIAWIEWLIVPLCLLAALVSGMWRETGQWLFELAGSGITPLWHYLQWLSAWPFAGWQYVMPSTWVLLLALLGAAWCLAPRRAPMRWLGVAGFLPMALVHPSRPPVGEFWVTMLDVGEGLAMTIQTASHLLIYDTGARIPNGFDAGQDVVEPYLQVLGAPPIDMLMISHGDNDHSGGAAALLANQQIPRLLTSDPYRLSRYHPQYCASGQQWWWDGVPFKVLWPPAGSSYQGNNSSCVLQVGMSGRRLLLTGDIEAPVEAVLITREGKELAAQILAVPHHGSKTSSTAVWLQQVHPQYALFSLGYFNRFHFPAPSVMQRYQSAGIQMWQTALDGAIKIKVPVQGPFTVTTANAHRYFWQTGVSQ